MAEKVCSSLNSSAASNMDIIQQDKKVLKFVLFIQVFLEDLHSF
jgi:hypothetical protein